ncbi:hypothetical protein LINPERHAP2_LOCUS5188 [Linum perenne]
MQLIGDRIGKTVRIDHTTLEGSREKEGIDAEPQSAPLPKQRPLGFDVNIPLVEDFQEGDKEIEDFQEGEKENVDPQFILTEEPIKEASNNSEGLSPESGVKVGPSPPSKESGPILSSSRPTDKAQPLGVTSKHKQTGKDGVKIAELSSAASHPSTVRKRTTKGGGKLSSDGGKSKGDVTRQQGKSASATQPTPADMDVDANQLGDVSATREPPSSMELL